MSGPTLVEKKWDRYEQKAFGKKLAGKTVAFVSGKGGVGKTNVVVNTAIGLARLQKRVTLMDADMSLGNLDVVLGMKPLFNLSHVLNGQKTLAEITLQGPEGIALIPASSGIRALTDISDTAFYELLSQMSELECQTDFLIFDVGAGIGDSVIQFALAADTVIVLTTPDPAALTDAYATIKVLLQDRRDLDIHILVNLVESEKEALAVFSKIQRVVKEFLQYSVRYLGFLVKDAFILSGVREQKPFMLQAGRKDLKQQIEHIALKLCLGEVQDTKKRGFQAFFKQLRLHLGS